jgi:transcriptional regulator with XRE-family HTH domain
MTPAALVARRVAETRGGLLWSQEEVARRMDLYGVPWSRTIVAKVESNSRQVTVDELVALAFVFGVPPASLLTLRDSEVAINITPTTQTPNRSAWAWHTGTLPMGGGEPGEVLDFAASADRRRRYFDAAPNDVAAGERLLPGVGRLCLKAGAVQRFAGQPEHLIAGALPASLKLLHEIQEDAATLARDVERLILEIGDAK